MVQLSQLYNTLGAETQSVIIYGNALHSQEIHLTNLEYNLMRTDKEAQLRITSFCSILLNKKVQFEGDALRSV